MSVSDPTVRMSSSLEPRPYKVRQRPPRTLVDCEDVVLRVEGLSRITIMAGRPTDMKFPYTFECDVNELIKQLQVHVAKLRVLDKPEEPVVGTVTAASSNHDFMKMKNALIDAYNRFNPDPPTAMSSPSSPGPDPVSS